jgi:hypothetical protein
MNTPHHYHIDTAFLQLSFAMNLSHFPDEHPIGKETFDIEVTNRDPGSRICLSRDEVQTYQDLNLLLRTTFQSALAEQQSGSGKQFTSTPV